MKKEDKELLIRDVCSRLPYKLKASFYGEIEECKTWDTIEGIDIYNLEPKVYIGVYYLNIEDIKPYLFPISNITEEQLLSNGLSNLKLVEEYEGKFYLRLHHFGFEDYERLLIFFYENHIDYLGLIEKGLAINATGLNIY